MKKQIALFFFVLTYFIVPVCAKSLDDNFFFSTVYISNISANKSGTGFLVQRSVSEGKVKVYLISNKHVISPAPINEKNKKIDQLAKIAINTSYKGKISKTTFIIVLRDKKGNLLIKGHPNPNVDVAAIVLSDQAKQPKGNYFAISEDRFATKTFIQANYISAGDRALIIGYPLNLVEQGHVMPVARNAIIATKPDESFSNLPAFLIDGTVIRGSSGSPVILPIKTGVWTEKHKVNSMKMQENYLIGIVNGHIKDWEMTIRQTMSLGQVKEFTIVDNSQLGVAFSAETILDVINLFNHKKMK